MRFVVAGALATGLLASPAFAQSSSSTWNDLPDRFQIDAGYFHLTANTLLRYDAPAGAGDVSLENDLGLDSKVDTFWLDATWRVGRRHQLKLGYTRLNRDRNDYTLTRDFSWGGQTYNAGLTASTTSGADILGGYYRFALVRNDRFEIGPTAGFGYLWLDAGIRATGSINGPGGPISRTLDESATTGSVTGALGGYADAWLAKRLVARADYLYIKVSPGDTTASVHDWRVGADFFPFRNAGVGVQYKYNKYSYDRGILVSKLGGEITYKGFQAFLSLLF